jgi:hypothetical protein
MAAHVTAEQLQYRSEQQQLQAPAVVRQPCTEMTAKGVTQAPTPAITKALPRVAVLCCPLPRATATHPLPRPPHLEEEETCWPHKITTSTSGLP